MRDGDFDVPPSTVPSYQDRVIVDPLTYARLCIDFDPRLRYGERLLADERVRYLWRTRKNHPATAYRWICDRLGMAPMFLGDMLRKESGHA